MKLGIRSCSTSNERGMIYGLNKCFSIHPAFKVLLLDDGECFRCLPSGFHGYDQAVLSVGTRRRSEIRKGSPPVLEGMAGIAKLEEREN